MSEQTPSILVIDDSPEIHRLLEVRLRCEGVRLQHALDPQEGLKLARTTAPDLILLDVDMPEATGIAVCRILKSLAETMAIPVVFLTSAGGAQSVVDGFDAGAVDYITKPFDPAVLRARVRAALRTKRYQDLLSTRAQTDALTGLRNRAYFDLRLEEELAGLRRYGRPTCLVMLDLDHFKQHNDRLGHPFGDRVLQRVAGILATNLRGTDHPCRYGGEEFGVILSETGRETGRCAAERLLEALRRAPIEHAGQWVTVTASAGLAATDRWPAQPPLTPQALVAAADEALYHAKREGRDRLCEADPSAAERP